MAIRRIASVDEAIAEHCDAVVQMDCTRGKSFEWLFRSGIITITSSCLLNLIIFRQDDGLFIAGEMAGQPCQHPILYSSTNLQ